MIPQASQNMLFLPMKALWTLVWYEVLPLRDQTASLRRSITTDLMDSRAATKRYDGSEERHNIIVQSRPTSKELW